MLSRRVADANHYERDQNSFQESAEETTHTDDRCDGHCPAPAYCIGHGQDKSRSSSCEDVSNDCELISQALTRTMEYDMQLLTAITSALRFCITSTALSIVSCMHGLIDKGTY